jgi:S-(hydroxymethyl)glutathione dehydrogenase/alcohol dehydrogenase
MARELGATVVIDASAGDPVERVRDLCPGGVDCAVEATGKAAVIAQALAATRPMGGTTVVAGNTPAGEALTLNPWEIIVGKRLVGAWDDRSRPDTDLPRYARLLAAGRIPGAASLLSEPYALHDVNRAVDDLEAGRVGRPLIDMGLVMSAA